MSEEDKPYSRLFNPERVCLSSKDDQTTLRADDVPGYYDTFRIQLPIPVLNVRSVEFLRGSIPCIYASLPDSELVFWYYRIPSIPGISPVQPYAPSLQYLHCVRIQPSFIPKDLLATIAYGGSQTYADVIPINRVYSGYTDLLTDLNLACQYDIPANSYFIENDIKFEFDEVLNKYSFTGLNPNYVVPNYILNPATTYQQNDVVVYNGTNYRSIQNNNPVNPALIIYNWTSSIAFKKYNVAYYDSGYYTAILNSTNVIPDLNIIYWLPSAYDPSINYGGSKIGFNCRYNNLWYVSISSGANTGNQPDESPTFWRLQPYNAIAKVVLKIYDWSSLGYYVANNVAFYNGVYYRAITSQEFIPPTGDPLSSTYWAVINYDDIPATYIPSRWRTGLVSQPFNTVYSAVNGSYYTCVAENTGIDPTDPVSGSNYWVLSEWTSFIHYSTRSPQGGVKDFPVYYNDKWYSSTALTPNDNQVPTDNPAYWNSGSLVMNWWQVYTDTITNFYSYAGYSDPNILIASQNLQSLTTNAYGIQGLPGQPFFKNRDLNLRLGFVWSGELLSQNAYRNHLRPVPLYLLGVGETFAFPTYTYIAESYGDLVNTSAIYVYCNVIGGSGYDSLGRPDLLTIVPLNTGSLGVAFYNNVISTPMIKVPREIYEIQFTLRTDTGDRYYLPDSAITNFEIKFNFL